MSQLYSYFDIVVNMRLPTHVVVVAVSFVATFLTHLHFSLTLRATMWLYSLEACMIIVTVYKLAQFESRDPDAAARSIVAFWVLQVLFEL